jgi:APA family basic amino acid/polyamine antiporter
MTGKTARAGCRMAAAAVLWAMEPSPTSAAAPSRLPRRLGLFSAVAVLVGSTIGSGIFRSPAGIADKLPGPLPLLSVWLFGGIFVLCGALTLAEVASAFPATGGLYVFIREAWGRRAAFLFGWSELLLIRAASLGAISTTFAEYLFRVMGHEPSVEPYATYVHWVAALAIALTATFNYIGLEWGSLVQNLTTVAKYGGLLFIVIVAIALGLPHTGGHFTPAVPPGSFSLAPFGLALISVLWAYDGWEDVSLVGGEVKDGRRTLPRAIIIGTVAVIAIYALANLAYLSVLDVETIRHSRLVAADVAFKVIGSPGVVFVAVTVMLSTFGTLNGSIMTAPRIFFAMADDRLLFKQIASVHPRFQTPYVAIVLNAAIGVAFVLTRGFEQLADQFVIAIVPFLALAVGAVFVLRRRPGYDTSFRVPGYPIVPLIFIASTVALLLNALLDKSSRTATLGVFLGILLGVPVYAFITRRMGSGGPTRDESVAVNS